MEIIKEDIVITFAAFYYIICIICHPALLPCMILLYPISIFIQAVFYRIAAIPYPFSFWKGGTLKGSGNCGAHLTESIFKHALIVIRYGCQVSGAWERKAENSGISFSKISINSRDPVSFRWSASEKYSKCVPNRLSSE